MPKREEEIRSAIENLDGDSFEDFAWVLMAREKFHGLKPTSRTHDKGEDATTPNTSTFEHDGKSVSLITSKTKSLSKLKKDCEKCKKHGHQIDVVVFVTGGEVRRDTEDRWKKEIKDRYRWDLEVYGTDWLAPITSHPKHEWLAQDYLNIPPPGGDYYQTITTIFSKCTQKFIKNLSREIPGIPGEIPRKEISTIEKTLIQGKPVVLVGDAGTGKSGIGASLAYSKTQNNEQVLFIDARKISTLKTEKELGYFLTLNGTTNEAISRIGKQKGIRVIIDQLDNIAGLPAADLLIELAEECSTLENVEVVIISRDFEAYGSTTLINHLKKKQFQEVESYELEKEEVIGLLNQLGINESPEVIDLSKNLLNLKIIGKIKKEQPDFNFSSILDEISLWDSYIEILIREETSNIGSKEGDKIVGEAIRLALNSLKRGQRIFQLNYAKSKQQERLISWGILREENPGLFRFQHEKMQDYFYAMHATRQQMMTTDVIKDLGIHMAKNIFPWMNTIYERDYPQHHVKFFREVMYV